MPSNVPTPEAFLERLDPAVRSYLDDCGSTDFISSIVQEAESFDDIKDGTSAFLADAGMDDDQLESFFGAFAALSCRSEEEAAPSPSLPVLLKPIESQPVTLQRNDRSPSLSKSASKSQSKHKSASPQTRRTASKSGTPNTGSPSPSSPPPSAAEAEAEAEASAAAAASSPALLLPSSVAQSIDSRITAISQQSRFHVDTLETLSNDIDMQQVTVMIGERELLVDANLRLFSGVHYGLLGKNGVGKSTLLKAIGYGILIGFPKNVRALYVEQLEDVGNTITVLDVLMNSNPVLVRIRREIKALQEVLEHGDSEQIAMTMRSLKIDRLRDEHEEAKKIATKRSGARGAEARQVLNMAEEKLRVAESSKGDDISPEESAGAGAEASSLLTQLFEDLDNLGGESTEGDARKILNGLGFSPAQQESPMNQLSGGWRIRLALARALFLKPDLLLLDEPTNHLDIPGITWLAKYIQSLTDVTIVTVSHDRAFLNAVTEEIIVYKNQALEYHVGNYQEYMQALEEKQLFQQRRHEVVEKKKAQMEKSVQQMASRAKKSGDDKKLSAAASKKKKIERLGFEKNEKGHRLRLNRDMVGYFTSVRMQADAVDRDPPTKWSVPDPTPLRNHNSLVEIDDVSFGYDPSKPVLTHINLNIEQNVRIGVIGANGEGKSTLMKLLVRENSPTKGIINFHPQAKIGYFSQNHVDVLHTIEGTPLSYLMSAYEGLTEAEARGHLSSFGLTPLAVVTPLSLLSGGQSVRVAIAYATYPRPHLLVLDEPTNHLDMDTIDAARESLVAFKGTVVVVSHDQWFVREVAQRVYLVENGKVQILEGGVDDYIRRVRKAIK